MSRKAFEGGQLRFLTDHDVTKIHEAALQILEEVGIQVPLPEALEVYRRAGAKVGPGPEAMRLPASMVETALRSTPAQVRLCGRDPEQDLVLEGRKVYAGTGGAEIHVLDLETGKLRLATLLDVARLAPPSGRAPVHRLLHPPSRGPGHTCGEAGREQVFRVSLQYGQARDGECLRRREGGRRH